MLQHRHRCCPLVIWSSARPLPLYLGPSASCIHRSSGCYALWSPGPTFGNLDSIPTTTTNILPQWPLLSGFLCRLIKSCLELVRALLLHCQICQTPLFFRMRFSDCDIARHHISSPRTALLSRMQPKPLLQLLSSTLTAAVISITSIVPHTPLALYTNQIQYRNRVWL